MGENAITPVRKFHTKLFGGIPMTWPKLIIFAVAAAIYTAAMLILTPAESSFHDIGVTFECWILFAVFIMLNCKSPLDSALKTFVFFLVSQPLIYLLQVPFYEGGFKIFMYYEYWFKWTLLTFPMALLGWFIGKRKWYSLLILSPAFVFLVFSGFGFLNYRDATSYAFPNHLLSGIFCLAVPVWLTIAIFFDWKKRLAGFGVIAAAAIVCLVLFLTNAKTFNTNLPDTPQLSEGAVIKVEDPSVAEVTFTSSGNNISSSSDEPAIYRDIVSIKILKNEPAVFTVTDGDKTYSYIVESKTAMDGRNELLLERKTDSTIVKEFKISKPSDKGGWSTVSSSSCSVDFKDNDTAVFTFNAYTHGRLNVFDENRDEKYSFSLYYDEDTGKDVFDCSLTDSEDSEG